MAGKVPQLDNRHYRAALMLAKGDRPIDICKAIGISKATLINWRKRSDFARMESGLREGVAEMALGVLSGYLLDACKTAGRLASGETEDDAVALRAALGVMDRAGIPKTQRTEHSGSVDSVTRTAEGKPDDELDAEIAELEARAAAPKLTVVNGGG